MTRSSTISHDGLRLTPWHGRSDVASIVPLRSVGTDTLRAALEEAAARGYRAAVTAALAEPEQGPFFDLGFEIVDRLHLLELVLGDRPPPPERIHRRGRRRDRTRALEVDAAAFPDFWRLDEHSLSDALTATPSHRFRVAELDGEIVAYAVTGVAAGVAYLQRLAVHPLAQRRGVGRVLVVDGVRWAGRRGCRCMLVNTQVGNTAALALYESLGFRRRADGLAVLQGSTTP